MASYSRQGAATTGRRQYSPLMTGRPPYYPKEPETITPPRQYPYSEAYTAGNYQVGPHSLRTGYYGGYNKNDAMAAQEEGYYENIERRKRGEKPLTQTEIHQGYLDKYKIPSSELSGLKAEYSRNRPDGSLDPSQGMAEGQTNVGAFAPTNQANLAGLAAQKGEYGKAALHGVQGLLASTIGMPASIVDAMLGPVISKGYSAVKGALGFGAPANSGSAVASGSGMVGLSGPQGLAQAIDLADLDIGNFGGGPGMGGGGGLGGGPGGTPGGLSGGVGTY